MGRMKTLQSKGMKEGITEWRVKEKKRELVVIRHRNWLSKAEVKLIEDGQNSRKLLSCFSDNNSRLQ